jgi:hypothetical protein
MTSGGSGTLPAVHGLRHCRIFSATRAITTGPSRDLALEPLHHRVGEVTHAVVLTRQSYRARRRFPAVRRETGDE